MIGKDCYIDSGVVVGDGCKIQNGVSLYAGVVLEDAVFMGPHSTTTNDRDPAAVNLDGTPKRHGDWQISTTHIRYGARIGAHATIVCGKATRTIGRWALVGAGSVVVEDVPDFALVLGVPARFRRYICPGGLDHKTVISDYGAPRCEDCDQSLRKVGGDPPMVTMPISCG